MVGSQDSSLMFKLQLEESVGEYEGFVTSKTHSALARFLNVHLVCASPPSHDFEKWFATQQEELEEEKFLVRLEAALTEGESSFTDELPEYLKLDPEMSGLSPFHNENVEWYFNCGDPKIVKLAENRVGSHSVPRLSFAVTQGESIISFNGSEWRRVPEGTLAAHRVFSSFEPTGKAVEELSAEFLPMIHLRACCWLRLPTKKEAKEAGLLDLSRADAGQLALPDSVPPFCYVYDSLAPIPISEPDQLPVVDEPREVAAILARTVHGVLLGDKSCEPPDPATYQSKPSFMIVALPVDIECV